MISIPGPCNEDWNDMPSKGCGRLCAACQETVTDFTAMPDQEFISYMQRAGSVPCGRVTERQLRLPIPEPGYRLPLTGVRKIAAALVLLAAGLPSRSTAQQAAIEQHTAPAKDSPGQRTSSVPAVIRGTVTYENGAPAIGATISIAGTDLGTVCDVDGQFILDRPGNEALTLLVKGLGYLNQTINVPAGTSQTTSLVIKLDSSLEEAVTQGIIVYKRPTLWQRLTCPFRKR